MTVSPDRTETMALASSFPERSPADWRDLAAGVVNKSRAEGEQLDGDAAVAHLRSTLPGDIQLDPVYWRPEQPTALGLPGSMPFTRGLGPRHPDQAWDVRQLHDDPDPTTSRRAVLDDLEHGVTSVWVHVGADGIAPGDVAEVLADVMLDLAPVVVSSLDDQPAAAAALTAVWDASEVDDASIGGSLGHDPIGAAAALGTTPDLAPLADAVRSCTDRWTGARAITVDTRVHHDAGATDQDEIALALVTGLDYVRHLTGEGVPAGEAFARIDFRVAATADQFATIAKLRALRRCWARVGEVLEVPEDRRGAWIHAVTSTRMQTRTDPWVNLLRSTIACFAAAAGGAEAITVLPYDSADGLPTGFSRRIARNTQSLLAAESHVARVADPAGGSWYVESLTDELAQAAWQWFGELDGAGGAAQGLASGRIAERLAATRAERDAGLATRQVPLTGTSTFPLAGEAPLQRTARVELPRRGLPRHRDSEVFERLRDRTAAAGGLSVPVLALGPVKEHTTRLTWVSNLLGIAGITPEVIEVGDDPAAAAQTVAGAPAVILATSPKGYAAHGAATLAALAASDRPGRVLLTGRTRELGETEGAAVDGELREGIDVVATLTDLLDALGAPAPTEGASA